MLLDGRDRLPVSKLTRRTDARAVQSGFEQSRAEDYNDVPGRCRRTRPLPAILLTSFRRSSGTFCSLHVKAGRRVELQAEGGEDRKGVFERKRAWHRTCTTNDGLPYMTLLPC